MDIPHFSPRRSGVAVLCSIQTPCLPILGNYTELVKQCFRDLKESALKRRILRLTVDIDRIHYLDSKHRQRFEDWQVECVLLGSSPSSSQLAACFLLCCSRAIWPLVAPAIDGAVIDFSRIHIRNFETQDYALYKFAKGIYTGRLHVTSAELANEEIIADTTLRLIINSILLARYGSAMLTQICEEGTLC